MPSILHLTRNTKSTGGGPLVMRSIMEGLPEFKHSVFGVFTKHVVRMEERTSHSLDIVGACSLPTTNDIRARLSVKAFRPSRFASKLLQPTFPFRLSRALTRFGPGVIHTHYPNRIDLQAKAILEYMNIPMLWTVHALPNADKHTIGQLERFNDIARAHQDKVKVIAVAKIIQQFIGKFCPDLDIEVIYNGVKIERSKVLTDEDRQNCLGINVKDRFVICSVARLNPEKGVEFLIHAASKISEKTDNVIFVHLGEGPLEGSLKNLVNRLGLQKRFFFLGHQSNVSAYLSASDLFVLPSLTEACSLALLEALFIGLPAVVTNVGGNPEISSPDCSVLVDPRDSDSIAKAILDLISDPERLGHMRTAALARSDKFSIEAMISGYRTLYDKLLENSMVSVSDCTV